MNDTDLQNDLDAFDSDPATGSRSIAAAMPDPWGEWLRELFDD